MIQVDFLGSRFNSATPASRPALIKAPATLHNAAARAVDHVRKVSQINTAAPLGENGSNTQETEWRA